MLRQARFLVLTVLMLFSWACGQQAEQASVPGSSAELPAPPASPPVSLQAALEQALEVGWQDLRIDISRRGDAGLEFLEIFSSGVAIWDGERQIVLPEGALRQALGAFHKSGFAALPRLLERGGAEAAKRVRCRVLIELDGASEEVILLKKEAPMEALLTLADDLFALARPAVAEGRGAADLATGLELVAAGELAPEVLRLLAHRKPELGQQGEGWVLNIRGARATVRRFSSTSGYGPPQPLELSTEQLVELSRALGAARFWELPTNVVAAGYSELKVSLFNHQSAVVARTFSGRDAAEEVENRSRLESCFAILDRFLEESD